MSHPTERDQKNHSQHHGYIRRIQHEKDGTTLVSEHSLPPGRGIIFIEGHKTPLVGNEVIIFELVEEAATKGVLLGFAIHHAEQQAVLVGIDPQDHMDTTHQADNKAQIKAKPFASVSHTENGIHIYGIWSADGDTIEDLKKQLDNQE